MKRIILFLVLVLCILFSACGQNVNDFEYRVNDDNTSIIITGYKGSVKDVRIPGRINGMPVVSIGNAAFFNNQLTKITIPENVDIQSHSFLYISVYDKYIREGKRQSTYNITLSTYNDFEIAILDNSVVEIIKYNGNTKDVNIPQNIKGLPVIAIGVNAFRYVLSNNQLMSINLPNSLTHIGDCAFNSNQLMSINLPNSLTYIGDYAFSGNQLTSVNLPNSLTYIGYGAFFYNQLPSVIIPSSVENLAIYAFDENVIITRE